VLRTVPGFGRVWPTLFGCLVAAAKTAAWHDREAPRDLYDVWGLARLGALDLQAAELFAALGRTGQVPQPWMFTDPPTHDSWAKELGGQIRIAVGPLEALAVVRDAWTRHSGAHTDRPRQAGANRQATAGCTSV